VGGAPSAAASRGAARAPPPPPLPSLFSAAAAGAGAGEGVSLPAPAAPAPFRVTACTAGGALRTWVALPVALVPNGAFSEDAERARAEGAAVGALAAQHTPLSLAALADTSSEPGRSPTGFLRLLRGGGGGRVEAPRGRRVPPPAVRDFHPAPAPSHHYLAAVGWGGEVVQGVMGGEEEGVGGGAGCGSAAAAALLPPPAPRALRPAPEEGACAPATALRHNPLLPLLYAAGWGDGRVGLCSKTRGAPLALCAAPWAPPSPVLLLAWVRAVPTVLVAVGACGAAAVWDVGAAGAAGGGGGAAWEPLLRGRVAPAAAGGVVAAACSGGGGGGAVTLLLATRGGGVVTAALHPVWTLPAPGQGAAAHLQQLRAALARL
jgi:hypothetical protein